MTATANFLKRHILIFIFLAFLLLLIFLTYKDYGVPWDEKIFFSTGKYFVVKLFNFLQIPTNLSTAGFEPTPHHIKGHGVFKDMLTVFAGMLFPKFDFETLHLIRALLAIPIFILVYWIVSHLVSKVYGVITVTLLLLFPRFYPEIYYNAVDIPTALLFTICLSYFIYYLTSKKTIFKSIIFGLILGVTINQRLLLFYLPVINFFFLLFNVILNDSRRNVTRSEGSSGAVSNKLERANAGFFAMLRMTKWREFLFYQFLILISLLLSMHLTHPYLLSHPITGLLEIIQSAKQYPWNGGVLFDGQFYQAGVKPLPWYYLIKTMLITIPPVTIFLFIIGNLNIILSLIRNFRNFQQPLVHLEGGNTYKSTFKVYFSLYCLAVFYTPFLLVFMLKPTLYDSWRQFLFLSIPMVIIAIFGLHWIFEIGNWKLIRNSKLEIRNLLILVIPIIMFINFLQTARAMFSLHPYEYLYYNSLVGGLKGAYGKYETDYWGLGYKDVVIWFNKNINDPKKQYKMFVEGDPLSSSYYFKSNMQLTTDLPTADYLFTFTRWNFHIRHPGKTIYTVEKEGVPLIFIKKL